MMKFLMKDIGNVDVEERQRIDQSGFDVIAKYLKNGVEKRTVFFVPKNSDNLNYMIDVLDKVKEDYAKA